MRNPEKISARRRSLLGEREGSFAEAKYLRMSATKVRRVIDLVRGQDAKTALAILRFSPQAAAVPARKALESAVANAVQQEGLEADDLYVSAIFADEGVTLRRIRPRAKGSASRILKRGAHLTVVVEPKPVPGAKKAAAKPAAKADAKAPKTDEKTAKAEAAEKAEDAAVAEGDEAAEEAPAKDAKKAAKKKATKAKDEDEAAGADEAGSDDTEADKDEDETGEEAGAAKDDTGKSTDTDESTKEA